MNIGYIGRFPKKWDLLENLNKKYGLLLIAKYFNKIHVKLKVYKVLFTNIFVLFCQKKKKKKILCIQFISNIKLLREVG